MATVTIRFRPQAWIDDDAVDVDAEGATEFEVPAKAIEGIKPRTCNADRLRDHKNAPKWVKEWHGPFEVEWDEEDD